MKQQVDRCVTDPEIRERHLADPVGQVRVEELQLPARDTRNIKKAEKKRDKDAALGRKIRRQATENGASNRESEDSQKEKS